MLLGCFFCIFVGDVRFSSFKNTGSLMLKGTNEFLGRHGEKWVGAISYGYEKPPVACKSAVPYPTTLLVV
jgi:hypothetical protein